MLLDIENLGVTYQSENQDYFAVNDVSLSVERNEIHGLVGESGSGKSTIADAILGLLPEDASVTGDITFDGKQLLSMSPGDKQHILWEEIAYIPQSAMDALDPVMTTGNQIVQAIRKHRNVTKKEANDRVREVFDIVGLDPERIDEYPHQFSGGMRQRVTIAMAIALEPKLIIADEPTTGLDVIIQDKILDKIMEIQRQTESSLLMITHDMGVITETTDRMSVLYGGKIMEQGRTADVISTPTNPYTMGLKNSFPEVRTSERKIAIPGDPPEFHNPPTSCVFEPRCPFSDSECSETHPPLKDIAETSQRSACHFAENHDDMREEATAPGTWGVSSIDFEATRRSGNTILETRDLQKWFKQRQSFIDSLRGAAPEYVKAVDGVSITIREGEVLGLAGESGCGKSTLGETVVGLEEPTGGEILYKSEDISRFSERDLRDFRKEAQIVFQDPYDSINPRQTVERIISEPLLIHGIGEDSTARRRLVTEALDDVGLTPAEKYLDNYPHELSGGEKQRVAVARAFVLDPDFIVCDEPASMLDVSTKMEILGLLRALANEKDVGVLYISHDLASLAYVADRLAVMYLGRIIERGLVEDVLSTPKHPYTSALVAANPVVDATATRERVLLPGNPPDPIDLPEGCNFAPRCPNAEKKCREDDPTLAADADETDQTWACFFPMETEEEISEVL